MSPKRRYKTHVTPVGVAYWAKVLTPDTKYVKEGEYSVELEMNLADPGVADLVNAIDDAFDKAEAANKEATGKKSVKLADKPYKDGQAKGTIRCRFKGRAKGQRMDGSEWEFRPNLYDHKGIIWSSSNLIGNGSLMKVSFYMKPFYTDLIGSGISLKLLACQILKHEEYVRSAESYGFQHEAGYADEDDDDQEKIPF
jgi:hypothetical protein